MELWSILFIRFIIVVGCFIKCGRSVIGRLNLVLIIVFVLVVIELFIALLSQDIIIMLGVVGRVLNGTCNM